MGSVNRNTILWSLSSKMSESRASELRTLFKDPQAAQVSLSIANSSLSLHGLQVQMHVRLPVQNPLVLLKHCTIWWPLL